MAHLSKSWNDHKYKPGGVYTAPPPESVAVQEGGDGQLLGDSASAQNSGSRPNVGGALTEKSGKKGAQGASQRKPHVAPPTGSGDVILPFWLVSTCEVTTIEYTDESTSMKLFTKWQFQNEKYFDRDVLSTLLHFDDDFDEYSKDEAIGTLLSGKPVNGVRVSSTVPSDCFPVNPDASIQNEVGGTQQHIGPSRMQLNLEERTVFCQLVFNITLHTPFNMKAFRECFYLNMCTCQFAMPTRTTDCMHT